MIANCQAERDVSACTTGDVLYCPCGAWLTVRHQDGGQTVLTPRDEPPTSWPKKNGKTRRP